MWLLPWFLLIGASSFSLLFQIIPLSCSRQSVAGFSLDWDLWSLEQLTEGNIFYFVKFFNFFLKWGVIIIYLQTIVPIFVFLLSHFRHFNLWPSSVVYQSSLLFLLSKNTCHCLVFWISKKNAIINSLYFVSIALKKILIAFSFPRYFSVDKFLARFVCLTLTPQLY